LATDALLLINSVINDVMPTIKIKLPKGEAVKSVSVVAATSANPDFVMLRANEMAQPRHQQA
jgi:hypothetical protein